MGSLSRSESSDTVPSCRATIEIARRARNASYSTVFWKIGSQFVDHRSRRFKALDPLQNATVRAHDDGRGIRLNVKLLNQCSIGFGVQLQRNVSRADQVDDRFVGHCLLLQLRRFGAFGRGDLDHQWLLSFRGPFERSRIARLPTNPFATGACRRTYQRYGQ